MPFRISSLDSTIRTVERLTELDDKARSVLDAILQIASAFDRHDLDTLVAAHYQGPESSMIPAGVSTRPFRGWSETTTPCRLCWTCNATGAPPATGIVS